MSEAPESPPPPPSDTGEEEAELSVVSGAASVSSLDGRETPMGSPATEVPSGGTPLVHRQLELARDGRAASVVSGISGVSGLDSGLSTDGAGSPVPPDGASFPARSVRTSQVSLSTHTSDEEEAAAEAKLLAEANRDTDEEDENEEAEVAAMLLQVRSSVPSKDEEDPLSPSHLSLRSSRSGGLTPMRHVRRETSGAVAMMDVSAKEAAKKEAIALKRAMAKAKREDAARRMRIAEERLAARMARRVRKMANLWGLAAGSSWDTSDDDSDGNRVERIVRTNMSRSWRVGLLACCSVEDSNGPGITCLCPFLVVSDTAERMDMKCAPLHGMIACIPVVGMLHTLMMRIKIKARYRIQYGIPLPQDLLAATLCCPCAVVQHRADVMGGYRRRRDVVIDVKPAQPKVSIEDDRRWGVKRYMPGTLKLANGSPMLDDTAPGQVSVM